MSDGPAGPVSATSTEENNGILLDGGMGNGLYEFQKANDLGLATSDVPKEAIQGKSGA